MPSQDNLAKKQAALAAAQEALASVLAKVQALKDRCACAGMVCLSFYLARDNYMHS